MNWKKYSIWCTILSGVIILVLCWFLFLPHLTNPECILIHDTIIIKKDSIIEKIKYKTLFDTIIDFLFKDTIIHDTVKIPIESKVSEFTIKKDSLTIKEQVHHSGFHSVIDSVELDYSWNYTLPLPKLKKFGWCVTVGPSISYGINLDTHNKTWGNGPSFGVSVVVGPSWIIK